MAVNAPIWKDTTYPVGYANSPFTYGISLVTDSGTEQIFTGKAWVRPGESYIHVNINKICQDYLTSSLPDLRYITSNTSYIDALAYRTFYLTNSGGTVLETFNFINDWSYESTAVTSTRLTSPINGHGAPGMFYLNTTCSTSSQNVITSIRLDYNTGYDNTHCGEYAIYYLQRNGGWASFLIEGNVTKKDAYKRYQISTPFDNTTLEFEKRTYHNEITTSYELKTGLLNDEQSKNLAKNLIGTNKAYLHNLTTGEILPILSTDGSAVYKTYRNQGRKFVTYSINVECSQTYHNA